MARTTKKINKKKTRRTRSKNIRRSKSTPLKNSNVQSRKRGGGQCTSKMCAQDSFASIDKIKEQIQPIDPDAMIPGEIYYISSSYDGELLSFEKGKFDEYISVGIQGGPSFRDITSVYMRPGVEPYSWKRPIYSERINPITRDTDVIGYTGEIRPADRFQFFEYKPIVRILLLDKLRVGTPKQQLPEDIIDNEIMSFL